MRRSPSATGEVGNRRMLVMRLVHVAVVVVSICAASKAHAVDHLMRISEIGLSKGGDTTIQFVELEDTFGESFPNNPYTLELFDADGGSLGTVTLAIPASTTRYLVATANADAAYGTDADAGLTVALPADGQACFTRGTFRIHCVAWGCINTAIVSGNSQRAPSPPDDMSVQRQGNGTYQVATPTPGAANQAGTMAANCPTDPDAPPTVDGPVDAGAIDALDPGPGDAGLHGDDVDGDDDGGCCEVHGRDGAYGSGVLALGLLFALRRRSRRTSKLGDRASG